MRQCRSFVYNHLFQRDTINGEHIHQVDLYCKFFSSFGLKCEPCIPNLKMPENIVEKAIAAIPESYRSIKPFIAINPNPSQIFPTRFWPAKNIIKFIELWYEKYKSPIMLTWGPGEEQASRDIINKVGKEKAFMHSPLKLNEFVALLSQLDLFISGDSGSLHMCWATGRPIIALFGPTTEEDVGPRGEKQITIRAEGIECARCHKEHCDTKKCMYAITPEIVLTNVQKILNQ